MNELTALWLYIGGVNLISFIFMGIDKQKAEKRAWRIPERTLWGLSIIGGAFGIWGGMRYFRHKTKHRSFMIGIPAIILIHIGVFVYIFISLS